MHFKNISFLLLLQLCAVSLFAQFKLSSSFGTSQKAGKNIDSTQFGNKSGSHFQINAAYYSGRLGIGVNVAKIQHNPLKTLQGITAPTFNNQIKLSGVEGGGINTTLITIGPELCLCYKKIKIMPTIKAGFAFLKNDTTKLFFETIATGAKYNITPENNNSLVIQGGIIAAYKINRHLGIAFNGMIARYNAKQSLLDSRSGTTTKSIIQPNKLLNAGLGAYYNF